MPFLKYNLNIHCGFQRSSDVQPDRVLPRLGKISFLHFSYPKNESSVLFWSAGNNTPNYKAQHSRRQPTCCCKNLNSHITQICIKYHVNSLFNQYIPYGSPMWNRSSLLSILESDKFQFHESVAWFIFRVLLRAQTGMLTASLRIYTLFSFLVITTEPPSPILESPLITNHSNDWNFSYNKHSSLQATLFDTAVSAMCRTSQRHFINNSFKERRSYMHN
jgi:hypothetical protein